MRMWSKYQALTTPRATQNPMPMFLIDSKHEVVICEGLYLLHDGDGWGAVKGLLDYSIFLDSDLEVCVQRVKIRNQCIPGYTVEEILERAEKVDRVNAKIVLQSKPYADLIVQSLASQKATLETS